MFNIMIPVEGPKTEEKGLVAMLGGLVLDSGVR